MEQKVNEVLSRSGIQEDDWWWDRGLNVRDDDVLVAARIIKALDDSGEFGPTRFNESRGRVEFGVPRDLAGMEDRLYRIYCVWFRLGGPAIPRGPDIQFMEELALLGKK